MRVMSLLVMASVVAMLTGCSSYVEQTSNEAFMLDGRYNVNIPVPTNYVQITAEDGEVYKRSQAQDIEPVQGYFRIVSRYVANDKLTSTDRPVKSCVAWTFLHDYRFTKEAFAKMRVASQEAWQKQPEKERLLADKFAQTTPTDAEFVELFESDRVFNLAPYYETDSIMANSVYAKMGRNENEKIVSRSEAAIVVNGTNIMLYCIDDKDNLKATQATIKAWADAIVETSK